MAAMGAIAKPFNSRATYLIANGFPRGGRGVLIKGIDIWILIGVLHKGIQATPKQLEMGCAGWPIDAITGEGWQGRDGTKWRKKTPSSNELGRGLQSFVA